jgi:hypothetical protein
MLYNTDAALAAARALVQQWQQALGEDVQVILGGSLVSGLFVWDETTEAIDVDVRFLVDDDQVLSESMRARIEAVTGLRYRKTIDVENEPDGSWSKGVMVEGFLRIPDIDLPLEVEGCLRNRHYISCAHLYSQVFSPAEFQIFRFGKSELKRLGDQQAYKAYKRKIRLEADRRIAAAGLIGI